MIAETLNWLMGGHSFGAGGISPVSATPSQSGEDFPQYPALGIRIPAEISLDDRLKERGLSPPPVHNQGPIGICTATAGVTAATYALVRALPTGNPPPWRQISPEPTFGWSKTAVVGGNPVPGGSTITNIARALRDFGCVPQAQFRQGNLSILDPKRAMDWSIAKVPEWLIAIGAMRPVSIYRVNDNPMQIREALACGAGVFAAFRWTFTSTDRNGMANLVPGVHCMAIKGRIARGPNGRPCLAAMQSYGTNMFSMSRGKPHPRFPTLGTGLIDEDRFFTDLLDRRVAYAVFPKQT